ncbi:hypothetical protein NDU88_001351 [Pleurodeles waltl]|uniref:Uncharacterized protein n=1 Tax=Pleurodeles waltl TaxID=8319 RepID=A0AAV7S737_PLEWA|nr:hypothetical protein NDU88_001351 [Pleurodeles waltl]
MALAGQMRPPTTAGDLDGGNGTQALRALEEAGGAGALGPRGVTAGGSGCKDSGRGLRNGGASPPPPHPMEWWNRWGPARRRERKLEQEEDLFRLPPRNLFIFTKLPQADLLTGEKKGEADQHPEVGIYLFVLCQHRNRSQECHYRRRWQSNDEAMTTDVARSYT